MEQILIQNVQTYAQEHQLSLAEPLGFGIHGIIFGTDSNPEKDPIASAIKAHRFREPFLRELAAYQRFQQAEITNILGFNVPQLLCYDDAINIIEMTIVIRPFVLDFAGAYLDVLPEFSDEAWAEWETEKRDQFGERWSTVQAVLAALAEFDIHMVDVSPSNIAFTD
jgi:hypothetical protein